MFQYFLLLAMILNNNYATMQKSLLSFGSFLILGLGSKNNAVLARLGQNLRPIQQHQQPTFQQTQAHPQELMVPHIVGGVDASQKKYPFMVHNRFCGASLIHEDLLLSAAHCESDLSGGDEVHIGQTYRLLGTLRTIINITKHPDYNPDTFANDIMILKLDSPVIYSPVQLNRNTIHPSNGDVLTVLGFGDTHFMGPSSNVLREVNLDLISQDVCQDQYGDDISISEDIMICAGDEAGKSSCFGDSGGPVLDSDGVQVGIVSFGITCDTEVFPSVHTRISSFMDWINEQICLNAEHPPITCGFNQATFSPSSIPSVLSTSHPSTSPSFFLAPDSLSPSVLTSSNPPAGTSSSSFLPSSNPPGMSSTAVASTFVQSSTSSIDTIILDMYEAIELPPVYLPASSAIP